MGEKPSSVPVSEKTKRKKKLRTKKRKAKRRPRKKSASVRRKLIAVAEAAAKYKRLIALAEIVTKYAKLRKTGNADQVQGQFPSQPNENNQIFLQPYSPQIQTALPAGPQQLPFQPPLPPQPPQPSLPPQPPPGNSNMYKARGNWPTHNRNYQPPERPYWRRSHLDDIYLPNYDDENLDSRHPYDRQQRHRRHSEWSMNKNFDRRNSINRVLTDTKKATSQKVSNSASESSNKLSVTQKNNVDSKISAGKNCDKTQCNANTSDSNKSATKTDSNQIKKHNESKIGDSSQQVKTKADKDTPAKNLETEKLPTSSMAIKTHISPTEEKLVSKKQSNSESGNIKKQEEAISQDTNTFSRHDSYDEYLENFITIDQIDTSRSYLPPSNGLDDSPLKRKSEEEAAAAKAKKIKYDLYSDIFADNLKNKPHRKRFRSKSVGDTVPKLVRSMIRSSSVDSIDKAKCQNHFDIKAKLLLNNKNTKQVLDANVIKASPENSAKDEVVTSSEDQNGKGKDDITQIEEASISRSSPKRKNPEQNEEQAKRICSDLTKTNNDVNSSNSKETETASDEKETEKQPAVDFNCTNKNQNKQVNDGEGTYMNIEKELRDLLGLGMEDPKKGTKDISGKESERSTGNIDKTEDGLKVNRNNSNNNTSSDISEIEQILEGEIFKDSCVKEVKTTNTQVHNKNDGNTINNNTNTVINKPEQTLDDNVKGSCVKEVKPNHAEIHKISEPGGGKVDDKSTPKPCPKRQDVATKKQGIKNTKPEQTSKPPKCERSTSLQVFSGNDNGTNTTEDDYSVRFKKMKLKLLFGSESEEEEEKSALGGTNANLKKKSYISAKCRRRFSCDSTKLVNEASNQIKSGTSEVKGIEKREKLPLSNVGTSHTNRNEDFQRISGKNTAASSNSLSSSKCDKSNMHTVENSRKLKDPRNEHYKHRNIKEVKDIRPTNQQIQRRHSVGPNSQKLPLKESWKHKPHPVQEKRVATHQNIPLNKNNVNIKNNKAVDLKSNKQVKNMLKHDNKIKEKSQTNSNETMQSTSSEIHTSTVNRKVEIHSQSTQQKQIPKQMAIESKLKTALQRIEEIQFFRCLALSKFTFPIFRKASYCIQVSDCYDSAVTLEKVDVSEKIIVVKQISTKLEKEDDVIEVKPIIPIIDLTEDYIKPVKDEEDIEIDTKKEVKSEVDENNKVSITGPITVYRSDETVDNTLEVQATSESISVEVLINRRNQTNKSDTREELPSSVQPSNTTTCISPVNAITNVNDVVQNAQEDSQPSVKSSTQTAIPIEIEREATTSNLNCEDNEYVLNTNQVEISQTQSGNVPVTALTSSIQSTPTLEIDRQNNIASVSNSAISNSLQQNHQIINSATHSSLIRQVSPLANPVEVIGVQNNVASVLNMDCDVNETDFEKNQPGVTQNQSTFDRQNNCASNQIRNAQVSRTLPNSVQQIISTPAITPLLTQNNSSIPTLSPLNQMIFKYGTTSSSAALLHSFNGNSPNQSNNLSGNPQTVHQPMRHGDDEVAHPEEMFFEEIRKLSFTVLKFLIYFQSMRCAEQAYIMVLEKQKPTLNMVRFELSCFSKYCRERHVNLAKEMLAEVKRQNANTIPSDMVKAQMFLDFLNKYMPRYSNDFPTVRMYVMLQHLMQYEETEYTAMPYLRDVYNLVTYMLSMRRNTPQCQKESTQVPDPLTPNQRKCLEWQITRYNSLSRNQEKPMNNPRNLIVSQVNTTRPTVQQNMNTSGDNIHSAAYSSSSGSTTDDSSNLMIHQNIVISRPDILRQKSNPSSTIHYKGVSRVNNNIFNISGPPNVTVYNPSVQEKSTALQLTENRTNTQIYANSNISSINNSSRSLPLNHASKPSAQNISDTNCLYNAPLLPTNRNTANRSPTLTNTTRLQRNILALLSTNSEKSPSASGNSISTAQEVQTSSTLSSTVGCTKTLPQSTSTNSIFSNLLGCGEVQKSSIPSTSAVNCAERLLQPTTNFNSIPITKIQNSSIRSTSTVNRTETLPQSTSANSILSNLLGCAEVQKSSIPSTSAVNCAERLLQPTTNFNSIPITNIEAQNSSIPSTSTANHTETLAESTSTNISSIPNKNTDVVPSVDTHSENTKDSEELPSLDISQTNDIKTELDTDITTKDASTLIQVKTEEATNEDDKSDIKLLSPEKVEKKSNENEYSAVKQETKPLLTAQEIEVIDLTWMDDVDPQELENEIEFVVVKKEEPVDDDDDDAFEEVLLNDEPFAVAPSPADSGISSPPIQVEYEESVFSNRSCICGQVAEYICECRVAMYCSADCQHEDWKFHKEVCLKTKSRNKDNNAAQSNESNNDNKT